MIISAAGEGGKARVGNRRRLCGGRGRLSIFISAVAMGIVVAGSLTVVIDFRPSVASGVACPDVVLVGAREFGAGQGTAKGFGNTLEQTRQLFGATLAGQRTVRYEGLSYGASTIGSTWDDLAHLRLDLIDGAVRGASVLQSRLTKILSSCNSLVVLAGYSQGALVIRLALSVMPSSIVSRVAGVALFGDPARHEAGDGLQHFGDAEGSGNNGAYEAFVRQAVDLPKIQGLAGSWCVKGDPVCSFPVSDVVTATVRLTTSWRSPDATRHGSYKSNGMASNAGYRLGQALLQLPRPVQPSAPATRSSPASPVPLTRPDPKPLPVSPVPHPAAPTDMPNQVFRRALPNAMFQ